MNSPRLRPYHNPENVDESRVPKGWRLLYEGERPNQSKAASVWFRDAFSPSQTHFYWVPTYTYIVPVA